MNRGFTSSIRLLVILMTLVLSISSCSRKNSCSITAEEVVYPSLNNEDDTLGDVNHHQWDNIYAIEVINGKAVDKKEFIDGLPRLELQIQQGRLVGFTGCNSFQAEATLNRKENKAAQIEIGPILSTKRGCPPAIDEQQFLQSLESATSILLSNNRIFFINMEGVITLQGLIVD